MLNKTVKDGLKLFDEAWRRYRDATLCNTRFIPYDQKERELAEYWQRRSNILAFLETDNEVQAIANLKVFIDAMNIRAEEMEKTEIKR